MESKLSTNAKGGSEVPFKGVPSDQVGRGSGQDPPDARDEDEPECEAIQVMKREAKEQAAREASRGAAPGASAGGARSDGPGGGAEADIGSVQRPPSDS
jgi:hypothetical protein